MNKIAMSAMACALVACATTQKYEAVLDSWVGVDRPALVAAWGEPTAQYPLQDRTILVYAQIARDTRSVREQYGLDGGPKAPNGADTVNLHYGLGRNSAAHAPDNPRSVDYMGPAGTKSSSRCITSFEIGGNDQVVAWHWEGNNCVAMTDSGAHRKAM